MLRLLWCWMTLIAMAGSLTAQHAQARLELSNGRVLHGQVESIDSKKVVFHASSGRMVVPLSDITAILGEGEEPGLRLPQPQPQEQESSTASFRAEDQIASGPDRALMRLLDRYLWFVPHSDGHRSSLGAALLVVLVLLVQLASRMANLEHRSFGRSAGLAVLILAMVVAEATYVPFSPVLIAAVAGFDLAVWFVAGMAIYRADLFQAVVLVVTLLLCSMVSVVLLQLAGVLVHAQQML